MGGRLGDYTGEVGLFLGPHSGSTSLDDADMLMVGDDEGAFAGESVAGAGDVDGDGLDDVLVGAPGASDVQWAVGIAYFVAGVHSGRLDLDDATVRFIGQETGDMAGGSVAGPGDVDGDGRNDVVIGAHLHRTLEVADGAVYLIFSPEPGTVALSSADARIYGEAEYAQLGYSVAKGGDLTGDGRPDVVMGTANTVTGSREGFAYIIYGGGL